MRTSPRALGFALMVIVDPAIDGWIDAVAAAIEVGGAKVAVQVRAEGRGAAELAYLTANVMSLARGRARVLVNDRADVARAVGADGVHLKEGGLEVSDARAVLGERAVVGASCHDATGLARRTAADYVVLGPFAAVPGKSEPLGAARFAALARATPIPVLALGGIDGPARAAEAIRAGASGIAVSRAILTSRDPTGTTRALLDALRLPAPRHGPLI